MTWLCLLTVIHQTNYGVSICANQSKLTGYRTICIDETMSLIDKFDKNVILNEARIIPQIQSSVDYRISTSHLNNILKQHLLLKKKKEIYRVCMLPSGISSHPDPDIDHISCVEFQGRPPNKRRKSSRLFTLNGVYAYSQTWSCISNWNM